jgi:thymidylate synthase
MTGQKGECWDRVYPEVLNDVNEDGVVRSSRNGEVREILGYEFSFGKPRSRCLLNTHREFNVFRGIGEWLWIMAGRNDLQFISFYDPEASGYSSDGYRLHGAYGPRLSGIGPYNQVENLVEFVEANPDTRQAIAPIFMTSYDHFQLKDDTQHPDDEIPCPIALHFLPREDSLHLITYMRSQNALRLMPVNVFIFSLIQEYISLASNYELGRYKHYCGSLHYHTKDSDEVNDILSSEKNSPGMMPPMTSEEPQTDLIRVLEFEEHVRSRAMQTSETNDIFDMEQLLETANSFGGFWSLCAKMILFWSAFQLENEDMMSEVKSEMHRSIEPFAERSFEHL